MKVLDKKTGKLYDPKIEFNKLLKNSEIVAVLKRLKDR